MAEERGSNEIGNGCGQPPRVDLRVEPLFASRNTERELISKLGISTDVVENKIGYVLQGAAGPKTISLKNNDLVSRKTAQKRGPQK